MSNVTDFCDYELLTEIIFSEYPNEQNKYDITHYASDSTEEDKFEILLNLYMNAILKSDILCQILTTKQSIEINQSRVPIDLSQINLESLNLPNIWFLNMGYTLIINQIEKGMIEYDSSNYYCRVLLKCDDTNIQYFNKNNIQTPYFFILNAKFTIGYLLNKIKAIFIRPTDNQYFSISFSPL